MSEPLLQVKNLHTSFAVSSGEVRAVNGVSFNLDRGKVLGSRRIRQRQERDRVFDNAHTGRAGQDNRRPDIV